MAVRKEAGLVNLSGDHTEAGIVNLSGNHTGAGIVNPSDIRTDTGIINPSDIRKGRGIIIHVDIHTDSATPVTMDMDITPIGTTHMATTPTATTPTAITSTAITPRGIMAHIHIPGTAMKMGAMTVRTWKAMITLQIQKQIIMDQVQKRTNRLVIHPVRTVPTTADKQTTLGRRNATLLIASSRVDGSNCDSRFRDPDK